MTSKDKKKKIEPTCPHTDVALTCLPAEVGLGQNGGQSPNHTNKLSLSHSRLFASISGSSPLRHSVSSVVIFLCLLATISLPVLAQYPQWWTDRNVINTNAPATNDYAVANLGQLKWFATNAYDELEQNLPGGAGSNLQSMVASFSTSNNYTVITLGQLKYTASLFYNRLIEEGQTNTYPWTTNTVADDNDYAAANIGQLKHVFSFDLDTDADGLPDWWEMDFFGDLDETANGDFDGDGYDNGEEYAANADPTYSNPVPAILIVWPMDGSTIP